MVCVFIRQSPISIRTPLFSEAFEQHVCVLVRRCFTLLELCGCARETGRTGGLHQKVLREQEFAGEEEEGGPQQMPRISPTGPLPITGQVKTLLNRPMKFSDISTRHGGTVQAVRAVAKRYQ